MTTRSRTGTVPERERRGGVGANKLGARVPLAGGSGSRWLGRLRGSGGAQLLEFAFAMPFLVVIAVGVLDFGQAYNLKHILTNAAREAARITVSNPLTDSSSNCQNASTPCSIQAAADAAKKYMTNAGLSVASCIDPTSPSSSGTLTWTYSCSSVTLTINRGYVFTATGGTVVPSTQVTLSYPYTWTLGRVIGLLVKGATLNLPATLTTNLVMQNLN